MNKIEKLISKMCPNGVPMVKLGDICKIGRGRVISKSYIEKNKGEYPVYSSQTSNRGILGYINTYDFEGDWVTWTTDGANAGTVFYRKGKFNCTNVCGTIKVKDIEQNNLNMKYLSLSLGVIAKNYVHQASGNPKIMNNVVERIKIPLPPIEIQNEIVEILEKFKKLEAELEAELEARVKQYEYYRNTLLSSGEDKHKALSEIGKLISKMCPNGMPMVKLGGVCELKNGYAFKSKDFCSEGIPVVRISDIKNSGVSLSDAVKIKESDNFSNFPHPKR